MKKLLAIVLLLLIVISSIKAQNKEQLARELINTNQQVTVKFIEKNKEKLNDISTKISIDNYKDGEVTAVLSKLQIDQFLDLGYDYFIEDENRSINVLNIATTVAEMSNWDRYPSYNVYLQMMQDYASNYPNICRLDTIGITQNGRYNLVLKITDNPDIHENEPEFLYTGQMHGDEIVAGAMFLRFIDYLLSNYGSNTEVSNLIDNIEIWINPISNLDGMYNGGNEDVSGASRYFANGVDPNRNFPNPVSGDHPDGNAWAPETVDMMNFSEAHDFVMSSNSHSGAEVVNYPWDSWDSSTKLTAYDTWWQFVSQEYADLAQANSSINYLTDVSSSGIINGGDWYVVFGSRQDYMNYYRNCREVTLELSSNKLLSSDLLPDHWTYNRDAMIAYLKQVQYGIRGIITDNCTGNPIKAKIEIENHDVDNSFVYSSLPIGNFHRPIYAGSYNVIVSADGYEPQTFSNITVNNFSSTTLNVALVPLVPIASYTYNLIDNCMGTYELINTTAGDVSIQWTFPNGSQSTNPNEEITFTENGNYTIMLDAINSCSGSNSISQTISVNHLIPTPTVSNIERCGTGDVTFSAIANGTGTISWFDTENGNLLATGNNYTTNLNNSTTLWVEETGTNTVSYGGKPDNTGTGGFYTFNSEHALIFDCSQEITLKSVKVYANGTANRIIKLVDASSNVIYQQAFNISDGESRVNLNWIIPVGNNYYLYGPAAPDLYRDGSTSSPNLPYPYNINGQISITGNTAGNSQYYYYFYDWEIEKSACSSYQVPITATIKPIAVPNYSYTQNGAELTFNNTSLEGISYTWNFGDGNTSTLENPIHTYATNGSYTVTLTATNSCGSVDYSETITITSLSIDLIHNSAFSISPNPARTQLHISNIKSADKNIRILDITGRLIKEYKNTLNNTQISINQLEEGVYFIQISNAIKKIIKR